ncbi:MAG: SHOCT domain-containing protein [Deltaproteobacteria bacterium]|nr:SHOCT domain-containing protein [Deltaproteobacteria bacterium]
MARYLFIAASFVAASFAAGCSGYRGPLDGRWDHMNYGCGFGGMFMWIFFVSITALVAYFVIQTIRTNTARRTPHETPLDILKRRYANGEITKEDYDKMKKDLDA